MAFDPNPATWIPGWSTSGTEQISGEYVQFPIASIPNLTATEAQGNSSGDVRKCWFALLDKLSGAYSAAQSAGNSPTKMTVTKSSANNTTTFIVSFQTQAVDVEVVNE